MATENHIRAGPAAEMGYCHRWDDRPLEAARRIARRSVQVACGSGSRDRISPPAACCPAAIKTPVLEADEWRKWLDSIPTLTLRDLRDRALIATLTYSFARISAALKMKVDDLRPRGAGWTVRLHEKGGKEHAMPCHHALADALRAYIDAANIAEDRKGWLFRTARGHKADELSDRPMNQSDAWLMIRRRAKAAGIDAPIGNHTFRATGITAYLANGGALEHAQEMAAHESPRTTKLYDRTRERLTQNEVERIRL